MLIRRLSKLPQLLSPLLHSDMIDLISAIWRKGKQLIIGRTYQGMYEVLDYQATLELKDETGTRALYRKREKVHFLQDNVIAFQDTAWGDGDIFAAYRCSPGVEVDRYREGHRYRVLISLRGTKNRGDVEVFHIQRTIRNGFIRDTEDFQTEIDHKTRQLSLTVIFPKKRLPRQVSLVEQNAKRRKTLGTEHSRLLPDGRFEVSWQTKNPRLFEAYIIHWTW